MIDITGTIQIPKGKEGWLEKLKAIYDYESNKISGPGSYRNDINRVLWEKSDMLDFLRTNNIHTDGLDELLDWLEDNRQLIHIQEDGTEKFLTRVGETIRILGFNYEYWPRCNVGVDTVRWLVDDKKIPEYDIKAQSFIDDVKTELESVLGDAYTYSNLPSSIDEVVKGASREIAGRDWKKATFSNFQLKSTKEILKTRYLDGYEVKTNVLTAGVGSGKTYGFSIPTLISAIDSIKRGEEGRRTHLFLYPRKALAKDQYKTISDLLSYIDNEQIDAHLEHSSFYNERYESVKEGIRETYKPDFKDIPPPTIIVTTLETLKRRLYNPWFLEKVSDRLKMVILDEIHLVLGLSGGLSGGLLKRLKRISQEDLNWIGSSATIAEPARHTAKIFGLDSSEAQAIRPEKENLRRAGIEHHVFTRPMPLTSDIGTLINTTSLLVHSRRDRLPTRREEPSSKSLAFADSLDILGRWNADLRENERIEDELFRPHPETEDVDQWDSKQREIPYAFRFYNPLQRRIETEGGKEAPFDAILTKWRDENLCKRCKKGERIKLDEIQKEELKNLLRLVYREKSEKKGLGNLDKFRLKNREIKAWGDSVEVGTLDRCPFLRLGACLWFPSGELEVEELPHPYPSYNERYDWGRTIRSRIYSSKTSRSSQELDDDLSEEIFRAPPKEIYDVGSKKESKKVPVDLVISSPSLEVGIDLENITEGVLFRAIRNVASYRQKVGRIGREERTDKVSVTQISNRPVDLHYYRQPWNLIDRGHLDPLPIPTKNDSIIRWMTYNAVWDKLAYEADLPETIPWRNSRSYGRPTRFREKMEQCLNYLENNGDECRRHLYQISKGSFSGYHDEKITEAIYQVKEEISLFLKEIPDQVFKEDIKTIADMLVYFLDKNKTVNINPERVYNSIIDGINDEYESRRPKIDPTHFGVSKEVERLDTYKKCGWTNYEDIKNVYGELKRKLGKINPQNYDHHEWFVMKEYRDTIGKLIDEGLEWIPEEEMKARVFFEEIKNMSDSWKRYYLSSLTEAMDIFEPLRKHRSQKRLSNLYTDPYESDIQVVVGNDEKSVQTNEFMFSMIPGTWTYRLGKEAKKVKVGEVEPEPGVLKCNKKEWSGEGNYSKIIEDATPPPDLNPDTTLDIYKPSKIKLAPPHKDLNKYLKIHPGSLTVGDGDEAEEISPNDEDKPTVKIPKSYHGRWVAIDTETENFIGLNQLDIDNLVVEGKESLTNNQLKDEIKHPLQGNLIDEAKWHPDLKMTDYVYSVTRQYSGGVGNVDLKFLDKGKRVAFGDQKTTEGVSITLNPGLVQRVSENIKSGILNGEPRWAPTGLKAVKTLISEKTDVSKWLVDDLVGILVSSEYPEISPDFPLAFFDILQEIYEDDRFSDLARDYFKSKSDNIYIEDGFDETEEDIENIEEKVYDMEKVVEKIFDQDENLSDYFEGYLDGWVNQSVVSSFGMASINALERLSGLDEQDIGYTIDLKGLDRDEFRIYLYDKTSYGNGSCKLMKRHFNILSIQRHNFSEESRALPSHDFMNLLQQELLQCSQFHTDIDAIEMIDSKGFDELGYISEESKEVNRVSGNTWKVMGITKEDAWKLPILHHSTEYIAQVEDGLETDDLMRATNICWSGCPECLKNYAAMLGSKTAENLLDKSVLDYLVLEAWKERDEFSILGLPEILEGHPKGLGKPSKLKMKIQDGSNTQTLRSYSLPYTLGLWLSRDPESQDVSLILQTSDILGLDMFEEDSKAAYGMSAMGFRRLMGYNLMMTSFLEILGVVPDDRKKIRLLFYDCRDIDLEELSVSPRIKEAIKYHEDELIQIEKLSDILKWLAKRGYDIQICVDKERSEEVGVKNFLDKMHSSGIEDIHVFIKSLSSWGNMHKKALQTPIAILQGSANLTYSGTRSNGELVNYFPYTTDGYRDTEVSIRTEFEDSENYRS